MTPFHKIFASLFALALLFIITAIIVAFIAPSKIHIAATEDDLNRCVSPIEPKDSFVGVALSGGGSRAALFAAAGLAALDEAGILEKITHVSSVSGGGLPAAYMATNATIQCERGGNGDDEQTCKPFDYEDIRAELMLDFSSEMLGNQAVRPSRWFHPSERVTALEQAFSEAITDGASLSSLPPHPVFMFNTVSYSTGKTFVMSNVALPAPEDAPQAVLDTRLRTSSFSKSGCMRTLPETASLAFAVASSASFPPFYGPVTISQPVEPVKAISDGYTTDKAQPDLEYIHLGDGGLTENTGLDTLFEAGLDAHARNPKIKALTLISFDAGLKIDEVKSKATQDLQIWSSKELTRLFDAPNLRGDRYRNFVRDQIEAASPLPINRVQLVYTDATIAWDEACSSSVRDDYESPAAFLKDIPTGFSITECAAAMLKKAAEQLVGEQLKEGGKLHALANQ